MAKDTGVTSRSQLSRLLGKALAPTTHKDVGASSHNWSLPIMTTEHDTTKQGHLLRVCVASLLGPLGAS